jgi:predicted RNase H-like nuclease
MKSSVFPAPVRATLSATSYEMACIQSQRVCDQKISRQTYGILPRVRDVDMLLRESPELLKSVHEVHPEVCFAHWNDRRPLQYPKKSGFGFMERFAMVERVFGSSPYQVRAAVTRKQATDDDILDAFAALWTAQRIYNGTATPVIDADDRDEFGLPMQMWT